VVSKTLELIFDFASPNAYLALKVLPPILARTGATLTITPALLGGIFKATNNVAPFVRFAETPLRMAYERLELERFVDDHGLTAFRMNPFFPINTITIMRGAMVAMRDGRLTDYVDVVLRAMWEERLNMGDVDVVTAYLSANGFDGPAMLAATQDPAIKAALVASTEAAVARGVFGIPSFFVGDAMFFGKERLGQVEAALTR
jgi:2-hydroxychromene-2-carboxylate isomerase